MAAAAVAQVNLHLPHPLVAADLCLPEELCIADERQFLLEEIWLLLEDPGDRRFLVHGNGAIGAGKLMKQRSVMLPGSLGNTERPGEEQSRLLLIARFPEVERLPGGPVPAW